MKTKTVKSTQPLLVLIVLHNFLIFSNHTAHAWSVEAVNIIYVRSLSFSSESAVKYLHVGVERFKYPLPWENKISQMPYPRANKDNQIPSPCPAPLACSRFSSHHYVILPFMESVGHVLSETKRSSSCCWDRVGAVCFRLFPNCYMPALHW